ncbi:hypothetical protein H9K75_21685 [Diaphorobacter aerolatus]|uniref:Uncharacterized protein n=1 Tax=Diaphorobacter aerolatus TaxID=1288495 RepID=A0A7H0GJN2_9BURK|nr:hypothetical protein H9K75_21685 [Diaphorobacter aerolatus]
MTATTANPSGALPEDGDHAVASAAPPPAMPTPPSRCGVRSSRWARSRCRLPRS